MKRFFPAIAVGFIVAFVGCYPAASAAAPTPLTTLQAIHALSSAEADRHLPVDIEATVTFFRPVERLLLVQDRDIALHVIAITQLALVPGDRIRVRGTTLSGFRPHVLSNNVTLLHHGPLPQPVHVTFEQLMHAPYHARLVAVNGIIRNADVMNSSRHNSTLQLLTDGGFIELSLNGDDSKALKDLLDAEVEVTGSVMERTNGKIELTSIRIFLSSLSSIRILRRASVGPWSLPVTPMGEIMAGFHEKNLSQRIRVHGTITYYQPSSSVVLQDGARSLWVETPTQDNLKIGDVADAAGFPDLQRGFLTLTHAEILDTHVRAPVTPRALISGNLRTSIHSYDLVSIEGQVAMEVRGAAQDEYVLVNGSRLFSAIYKHPSGANYAWSPPPTPPMKQVPIGSTVQVVGVCVLGDPDPFNAQGPFDIVMRSEDDITVVHGPSWLTVRHLATAVGILLLAISAVGAWNWMLRRKVKLQTEAMAERIAAEATLERRRSRILEEINGKRPLSEIVEQVTELVSFSLRDAPCWCRVGDGAPLGHCPSETEELRVVSQEIPSHAGPSHGELSAAFSQLALPCANESEALSMGTWLISLAIETRGLYSDLLRRSEFDLLTDTRNRFSFEKRLSTLIEAARLNPCIFGLVYIDLDKFKEVNDRFGHQVGDLYLQEASLRMQRQLRAGDMLARLGGDEFAVLVTAVGCRADVEEVAMRLERCFDEPFHVDPHALHGSASTGVAVYPEDALGKDALLSAADTAMYRAKNSRKQGRSNAEIRKDNRHAPSRSL